MERESLVGFSARGENRIRALSTRRSGVCVLSVPVPTLSGDSNANGSTELQYRWDNLIYWLLGLPILWKILSNSHLGDAGFKEKEAHAGLTAVTTATAQLPLGFDESPLADCQARHVALGWLRTTYPSLPALDAAGRCVCPASSASAQLLEFSVAR